MKRCELCSHFAWIYCQSDNASLCYDCDQTVHSSNFLVVKHSRILLCHKCQSPTPWTASGIRLGRAATVCVTCLDHEGSSQRPVMFSHRENDVEEENRDVLEDRETDDEDIDSGDESEDDDDDDDDDEDAENQVVPRSSDASPPITCSSSSEQFSLTRSTINRERLDIFIDSEDDAVCSSERSNIKRSTEISLRSFRPLKVIRSDTEIEIGESLQ